MIIVETLEDFKEVVKKITAKVRGTEVTDAESDSPLVKAIRENCGNVDSDLRPIFSALVEAIEGRKVAFSEDGIGYSYPRYSAVVPLEETHSHDYPLNQAFIVRNKDSDGQAEEGIKATPEDSFGNTHFGNWRYATDEEIDALFATFRPEETEMLLS